MMESQTAKESSGMILFKIVTRRTARLNGPDRSLPLPKIETMMLSVTAEKRTAVSRMPANRLANPKRNVSVKVVIKSKVQVRMVIRIGATPGALLVRPRLSPANGVPPPPKSEKLTLTLSKNSSKTMLNADTPARTELTRIRPR